VMTDRHHEIDASRGNVQPAHQTGDALHVHAEEDSHAGQCIMCA